MLYHLFGISFEFRTDSHLLISRKFISKGLKTSFILRKTLSIKSRIKTIPGPAADNRKRRMSPGLYGMTHVRTIINAEF
jgi:hypothetical protein